MFFFFFFFNQKTAYEMRISDWSSDVCSSDLDDQRVLEKFGYNPGKEKATQAAQAVNGVPVFPTFAPGEQQADPARFTDFNDLQQNSRLGREGVVRQDRKSTRLNSSH